MKYELPSIELIVIEENDYLKFGEYLNDMQCDDTTNKLCLDDLEYVKKLQQENKQLKDNWNKLKEYLHNVDVVIDYSENYDGRFINYDELIDKIKELETPEEEPDDYEERLIRRMIMNKISFIIEFDEVSKTQEEQLTEFIEKTGIKFHVLENDNDLKKYEKYKEVIDKLKNKTKENIENAKCEITTLTIGDKAYYQYIEKILDNYVDILKEVE